VRADRTRPVRFYNRRCRKIIAAFALALSGKEHAAERREQFEGLYAPLYRDYGRRVEDADRARAIREADQAFFVGHRDAEITIVDGRIVVHEEKS
jgi:hypothetical protein